MATFPKYNTKFVERDKIDTPNTQISLSWCCTCTSIKRCSVRL